MFLCNKVVPGCNLVYILLIIQNTTGCFTCITNVKP